MVSAGRVLLIPKGAWNSTDTYSMLDLVSYNGSSYIAKTSVPANTLPTNTSYWQLSAYGGSAANLAGNFAPLETTDYASRGYAIGEFLVNKNNQFCVATSIITIGDQIIVKPNAGYNVETTDAGTEINRIDLRIDQLTASQIGYDGTTSGLSATDAQAAIDEVVGSLSTVAITGDYDDLSDKPSLGTAAAKDSTSSVTQSSTDLVESGGVYTAIGTEATARANADTAIDAEIADMVNILGAKNLNRAKPAQVTWAEGITSTPASDGTSFILSGTATATAAHNIGYQGYVEDYDGIKGEKLIFSDGVNDSTKVFLYFWVYDSSDNLLVNVSTTDGEVEFTLPVNADYYRIVVNYVNGVTYNNLLVCPMLRPASIKDDTYAPHVKTNRDLTFDPPSAFYSWTDISNLSGWETINYAQDYDWLSFTAPEDGNYLGFVNPVINVRDPDTPATIFHFAVTVNGASVIPMIQTWSMTKGEVPVRRPAVGVIKLPNLKKNDVVIVRGVFGIDQAIEPSSATTIEIRLLFMTDNSAILKVN